MCTLHASRAPLPEWGGQSFCGSLQFQLEVEERERSSDQSFQVSASRLQSCAERLRAFNSGSSPFCAQLQRDVRRLLRVLAADGPTDVVVMASRLSLVGYNVTVRTAIGGGPSCFRNLRHEFLTVAGEDDYKEAQFIVDPHFKEQFQIPNPSATYQAVLGLIPEEFVGTTSRLIPLVQCLCAEMVASFECQGLTLPPWRRAQSMLSKWLPSKSRDISFCSSSSSHSGIAASSSAVCGSESEGGSPTDTSGASSPFSRISDSEMMQMADKCSRSGSKSLLSGKLSSTASSTISRSSSGFGPRSTTRAGAAAQQQVRAAAAGVGTVSMQPSLYQGQPSLYKVKMGSCMMQGQQ